MHSHYIRIHNDIFIWPCDGSALQQYLRYKQQVYLEPQTEIFLLKCSIISSNRSATFCAIGYANLCNSGVCVRKESRPMRLQRMAALAAEHTTR